MTDIEQLTKEFHLNRSKYMTAIRIGNRDEIEFYKQRMNAVSARKLLLAHAEKFTALGIEETAAIIAELQNNNR